MPEGTGKPCEECGEPAEFRVWGEHYDYERFCCAAHKSFAIRMTKVDIPAGIPVHVDLTGPSANEGPR